MPPPIDTEASPDAVVLSPIAIAPFLPALVFKPTEIELFPLAVAPVPMAKEFSPLAMLLAMSLNIKEFTPVPNFIIESPRLVAVVQTGITPMVPAPIMPDEIALIYSNVTKHLGSKISLISKLGAKITPFSLPIIKSDEVELLPLPTTNNSSVVALYLPNTFDSDPVALTRHPIATELSPDAVANEPIAVDTAPCALFSQPIATELPPTASLSCPKTIS